MGVRVQRAIRDSVLLKGAALAVGLIAGIGLWLLPAPVSKAAGIPVAQALELRDPGFSHPTPAEAPTLEGSPSPTSSPLRIPLTGQEGTEVLVGNIPARDEFSLTP